MSAHIEALVEELSKLSVLDMSKLKTALEIKWDVKAAVGVAAGPAIASAEPVAESTEFKVLLKGPIPDDKKIVSIKTTREITGLGLKEAKELCERANTEPQELKPSASKAEADEIVAKFQAVGLQAIKVGL